MGLGKILQEGGKKREEKPSAFNGPREGKGRAFVVCGAQSRVYSMLFASVKKGERKEDLPLPRSREETVLSRSKGLAS